MENMSLCPVCHEEVFENEEIRIQGVPYHEWCYGEEYLDEVSGTGGAVGYSSSAFTLNYPEKDDDDDEKEVSDTKRKKEDIDEEILKKIDEMSSSGGGSIQGFKLPLGQRAGNVIKDPYKRDRQKDYPEDSDNKIKNDGKGRQKIHPLFKMADILSKK
jgi:hypothetical protein